MKMSLGWPAFDPVGSSNVPSKFPVAALTLLYVGPAPRSPLILNTLIRPSPLLLYPAFGTKLNSKEKGPGLSWHGRLVKETTRSTSFVLPASWLTRKSKARPPSFVTLGDDALKVDEPVGMLGALAEDINWRTARRVDGEGLLKDATIGNVLLGVRLLEDVLGTGMLIGMEKIVEVGVDLVPEPSDEPPRLKVWSGFAL